MLQSQIRSQYLYTSQLLAKAELHKRALLRYIISRTDTSSQEYQLIVCEIQIAVYQLELNKLQDEFAQLTQLRQPIDLSCPL